MPIEYELGLLIRKMNPYTDGIRESMRLRPGAVDPVAAQAVANATAAVAAAAAPGAVAGLVAAADLAENGVDLSHIGLVMHDHFANYTSAEWIFRGEPLTVKRALRIAYRYQLRDGLGRLTGLYANENLLIGYAGGNGP